MSVWYRVSRYSILPAPREFARETQHMLFDDRGRKFAKCTQYERWFSNEADAAAQVASYRSAEARRKADNRVRDAAHDLLEACKRAIPSGVCLTNKNVPDDFTVALDCTMADLRFIAAAIARATGEQP